MFTTRRHGPGVVLATVLLSASVGCDWDDTGGGVPESVVRSAIGQAGAGAAAGSTPVSGRFSEPNTGDFDHA